MGVRNRNPQKYHTTDGENCQEEIENFHGSPQQRYTAKVLSTNAPKVTAGILSSLISLAWIRVRDKKNAKILTITSAFIFYLLCRSTKYTRNFLLELTLYQIGK